MLTVLAFYEDLRPNDMIFPNNLTVLASILCALFILFTIPHPFNLPDGFNVQQVRHTLLFPQNRLIPIVVASDSDDCVIVDSLQPPEAQAQPSRSPEVT